MASIYMGYRNLQSCVADLKKTNQLIQIDETVDGHLEVGAIQRRVYQAGGPALLFTQVKGCTFPMLGNLFGTIERTRWLFRDTLNDIERLVSAKVEPQKILTKPLQLVKLPFNALKLLPKTVKRGPILYKQTVLSELPHLVSWPKDGGAFITLPQVYTEHVLKPGFKNSNLGMYRVQLSGNDYKRNEEVGLHYQIHRGIGVHHTIALQNKKNFRVNIFVGGPPAMTIASIMPLPEGLTELGFAGVLAGHRMKMIQTNPVMLPMLAEADFCISGVVDFSQNKPEGPFGDHLGYYSLQHPFPVLKVDHVWHRKHAIWPFTTVGRPPQEDTNFGQFIHELTGRIIPDVLPGIHSVNAVDAAGVHPLLLAVGSERYTPYLKESRPQELLTQAHALLGQGQLSLAKYLFITNHQDNPELKANDISEFFQHVLARIDLTRDLHFITKTTMDTLDYSGEGMNQGSKLIIAASGPARRQLGTRIPYPFLLPDQFSKPEIALPGVLCIQAPPYQNKVAEQLLPLVSSLNPKLAETFPLIVLTENSEFAARNLNNFLWITFTRSNPAADIHGVHSFTEQKHWGCHGPIVIDARIKPHHAPALEDHPETEKKVDQLGAVGGPLHGII